MLKSTTTGAIKIKVFMVWRRNFFIVGAALAAIIAAKAAPTDTLNHTFIAPEINDLSKPITVA